MKNFVTLLILFSLQYLTAQEKTPKVSLSLEQTTLEQVLGEIEQQTALHFFYVEEWVKGTQVTANYNEIPVSEVLEKLLEQTLLNYYFLDNNRVVITKSNIIYDQLPQGFFPDTSKIAAERPKETKEYNPVFYTQNKSPKATSKTIFIGKETQTSGTGFFNLTGQATNQQTGEPISNLSIIVQGTTIGTVTDINGNYNLRLPAGEHLLETRSLGNEDVVTRLVIFSDGTYNLNLKEDYELLGEVLVDSNQAENVEDAIGGTEDIDISEIKNIPLVLGERDVMKVAVTLPGISTTGEGSAGFNVRGGKTDQNLILIDDAVLYNPAHFFGIFSAVNPFTTGDMTIYKGNIPARFGGRLSSVFDITSKDANTQKFAGEVSVGPVTSNVALEIPVIKEKSGLLLGGRSTYSDWILKNLDDESLKDSEASFYDVIAKYNHKFSDKTNFKATGYFSRDNYSITSDSLFNYQNLLFSMKLNHKFNDKNDGSLILTNSHYNFDIDYESEYNNNFTSGYKINETEVKLNMRYLHNAAHKFDYGISTKLYNVHPGKIEPMGSGSIIEPFEIPKEKGLESAIYLADNFTVNNKLLLSGGLRYSHYAALGEKNQKVYEEGLPKSEATVIDTIHYGKNEVMETYGGPEVRLSARYLLLPDLSLKLSYNNAYQYIHTLSNNTTVSPTDTYKLSDKNIKPQRANQYSLGLYKNFNNNMYEVSVEGYYKESDNILDYKVGAQLFLNENIETEVLQGEGRSFGAEFLLKKTEGRLNGWLGYTYSKSELKLDGAFNEQQVNNGEYFPANYDKPHDLSLVANYKLTHRFSFSANFVYQTGRPVTFPTGKYYQNGIEYVLYSDRNKFRIPDYYRLDLSFNVEGNHKIKKFAHSFWNISVYNVLGRNNPYSVFFVTEEGEVKAYKSSIFSIPVPTITYNFRF